MLRSKGRKDDYDLVPGWKGAGKCFLKEMFLCSFSQLEEEEESCKPTEKRKMRRVQHTGIVCSSPYLRGAHSKGAKRDETVCRADTMSSLPQCDF